MVSYQSLEYLPSSEELPDSDDTPVDNELQNIYNSQLAAVSLGGNLVGAN